MIKTFFYWNIFKDYHKIFQCRPIPGLYLKRLGAKAFQFQREALFFIEICCHNKPFLSFLGSQVLSKCHHMCESIGRLKTRSVSSSIFCMYLLSAFNIARFKFQGSGSNTLEVMSICLNHIEVKKFQRNL